MLAIAKSFSGPAFDIISKECSESSAVDAAHTSVAVLIHLAELFALLPQASSHGLEEVGSSL